MQRWRIYSYRIFQFQQWRCTGKQVSTDYWIGSGLRLYPNPSTGIINIEAQLSASGDLVGEIKNTMGQTIYTFHDQTINSFYKKSIALNLPDGIYFLSLQHNGGRTVKKFEVFR